MFVRKSKYVELARSTLSIIDAADEALDAATRVVSSVKAELKKMGEENRKVRTEAATHLEALIDLQRENNKLKEAIKHMAGGTDG